MNLGGASRRLLERLPGPVASAVYRASRRLPGMRRLVDDELDSLLAEAPAPRPGADVASYSRLPESSRSREAILDDVSRLASAEEAAWREGRASGAVYHGDAGHVEFLNHVYALHSQSNPLHTDLWPSGVKFEAEVVSMTAAMLGAEDAEPDEIVGTVTSGGTESIVMAVKAYRDHAGSSRPEMVIPETAHVAFDKAAELLGVRPIRVPVGPDGRADVASMASAVGRRTILVAGSAPGFPHGLVDPIPELADLAHSRGIGLHVDACLGGFVLPWAERLGCEVPAFDFRLRGVTSMSADTHKYGYAPKGTSVVLYRGRELRRAQYHVSTDWPGGLYYSTTLAGSRPGGLVAAAWAAMLSMGKEGYLRATEAILETAAEIRSGIDEIPELSVIGDPLWVIAFRSETVDVYEVMARMAERGWSLNGLHRPPAVHIAVTLRHTHPGVAGGFLSDLRECTEQARSGGREGGTGMAPVYGMAAGFPARGAVADLLRKYVDRLYEIRDDEDAEE
jgi:sphinganine-1-phosphate aldolase